MKITGYLAVLILITGCYRNECPGYPDKYLNWIPYKEGDSIFFTDGTYTFKLFVEESYKTSAFKEQTWIIEKDCFGEARVSVSGDSASPGIREYSIFQGNSDQYISYFFDISYNGWTHFVIHVRNNDITAGYGHLPQTLLPSYYNGYKEYSDVLKLDLDTLPPYAVIPVYQVYIAESVGIIQFKERKNHKIWSLIGK
jgi:hypothetical protein